MLEGLMRFLGKQTREEKMAVEFRPNPDNPDYDETDQGFYIVEEDGRVFAGPYKRQGDAQGQLTRMRKQYTPAARRPRG